MGMEMFAGKEEVGGLRVMRDFNTAGVHVVGGIVIFSR